MTELGEKLKSCRRLDQVDSNMELNPDLVAKHHNDLLGGGTWSKKISKTFRKRSTPSPGPNMDR